MASLSAVGLLQRNLTAAFISRAPVDVELAARVATDDGEGGRATTLAPARSPLRVTLCEPGSSGYGPPSATTDGTRRLVDLLLVASWDADVRDGDEFDHAGARYRVDQVLPANGWEVRAYVVRAGDA